MKQVCFRDGTGNGTSQENTGLLTFIGFFGLTVFNALNTCFGRCDELSFYACKGIEKKGYSWIYQLNYQFRSLFRIDFFRACHRRITALPHRFGWLSNRRCHTCLLVSSSSRRLVVHLWSRNSRGSTHVLHDWVSDNFDCLSFGIGTFAILIYTLRAMIHSKIMWRKVPIVIKRYTMYMIACWDFQRATIENAFLP